MFSGGRVDVMVIWDGFGEPRDECWLVLDAGAWRFLILGSVCGLLMGIEDAMGCQCRRACVDG